jgi:hypothetical protein
MHGHMYRGAELVLADEVRHAAANNTDMCYSTVFGLLVAAST